ncbi:glycosyltransferase family 2 protein [Pseudoxanthomonas sp. JBR18]|uniref:glycosyltransferase family 2 protein n=1 Tax=Pseudoxanthomonas sp. JBR18 TaxID=2969308 RepID=UPI002306D4FC|nr:glycosyltransferase family 2 protein [Pseudoxanthomonas sp. JBR18]WCE03715.1 glycosyltransferase family 2 protein [Pseudoxanthomonas sp. JBR18]
MSQAQTPCVSVVVTNYNYGHFVCEAVDSALAQHHLPLEVIVVDDGSTDGSLELLRERYGEDARVKLLPGVNGGQLSAFVRGLAQVQGEWVCFLDADDRWGADYLSSIVGLIGHRPDVDFVFSDVCLIGNEQGRQGYADQALDLGYTALSTWVTGYWHGAPTSALAMRRTLAQEVLTLPAEVVAHWRISADNALVFGASVLGARKYYLPTGQVDYRIHGGNGWWHDQARAGQFAAKFRSRSLINLYAQRMRLDVLALDLVKMEFQSRPQTDWVHASHYARIALRGSAPWWKRVERALAILRRGLKGRRRG